MHRVCFVRYQSRLPADAQKYYKQEAASVLDAAQWSAERAPPRDGKRATPCCPPLLLPRQPAYSVQSPTDMVWIAHRRGPVPRSCGPVGPARPAAACWKAAAQQEAARLTLPPFSLRPSPSPPSPLDFERCAAAVPLGTADTAEWEAAAALLPLSALQVPTDGLQLQPQLVQLPQCEGQRSAVPACLLLRTLTPYTDAWERHASATADPPCLSSAPDDEEPEVRH